MSYDQFKANVLARYGPNARFSAGTQNRYTTQSGYTIQFLVDMDNDNATAEIVQSPGSITQPDRQKFASGTILNSEESNRNVEKIFITNPAFYHWSPGRGISPGSWGSSLMAITPGGQVGIGTSTPAATLDVRGSVNLQGPLTVGDNFAATIGCADLLIGWSGRRGSPGRALSDLGTTLDINCCGDWANTYVGGGNFSVCSLTIRGGGNLAEPFPTAEGHIDKGAVMVIDEEHPGQLKLSGRAYDTRVAGIVSGAKGIHPGISLHQEGAMDDGQDIALSGRVYVQADAAFGAITPGDLLTTSDTPGHAMKVTDRTRTKGRFRARR